MRIETPKCSDARSETTGQAKMQQTNDHDFIPDERQTPNMNPPPLPKAEPPAKKPGFFSRLFGPGGNQLTRPAEDKLETLKPQKPEQRSGEMIDVSTGVYRGRELNVPKNVFEQHVRENVKDILPKFSARNTLAKELSPTRSGKITKSEVRGVIKKLEQAKRISHKQASKLRGKFGARSSSFF